MRRSLVAGAIVATLSTASAHPTAAGAVLDRVLREGVVRCAATERPGFAFIRKGEPTGRAADICRALARAVLGGSGRFALRLLDPDSDADRLRDAPVELALLEPRTVRAWHLERSLTSVAEAYREPFAIMVPRDSPSSRLADVGGRTICFMIGDPVWPVLHDGLARRGVPFQPFGFSEAGEMTDAYAVGRCGAVAGLASVLEAMRADDGLARLDARLIEEPLGMDTVMAMVEPEDPEWERRVGDTLATLPDR